MAILLNAVLKINHCPLCHLTYINGKAQDFLDTNYAHQILVLEKKCTLYRERCGICKALGYEK